MAKKSKLSDADLQDLVPKLDQFVSTLNSDQQTALSKPFKDAAKGGTPQKSIQDFLDKQVGNVHPATRSIVLGIVGGGPGHGGRGAAAGIVGGGPGHGGRGAAAGIVGGGPGGGGRGRGAAAGIVGGKGRGTSAGIVSGPGGKGKGPSKSKKKK